MGRSHLVLQVLNTCELRQVKHPGKVFYILVCRAALGAGADWACPWALKWKWHWFMTEAKVVFHAIPSQNRG